MNHRGLRTWRLGLLAAACLCAGGGGCQRYLVATPNLLLHQDCCRVYDACPPELRTPEMDVIYATDRNLDAATAQGPRYGYHRSKSLAFGTAQVTLAPQPQWRELVSESTLRERKRKYAVQLGQVREEGSFAFVLDKLRPTRHGLTPTRQAYREIDAETEKFHDLLRQRLARTPQKDVFIFVHGFNTSFEDAVYRPAEVWHFMGRVGVPVAYTWPAGFPDLRGYAYDRESGEFTIFHLKNFIRTVAACPEVERIHLVAHSRGSDVTISALRELHIEFQARGESTAAELKLENLVLAAPDLDEEVFMQRFAAENMLEAARRTTIYASGGDRAMSVADFLFASRRRLGSLAPRDFSPQARAMLAHLPNFQFVECKVKQDTLGHDYVFSHPAALSDLILVLRDRRAPGFEHGRPLRHTAEGVWELDDQYLLGETPAVVRMNRGN
jgi:esterase/lipase superfamily enzyme